MWGLVALLFAQSVPIMPGSPGLPPFPYTPTQVCEGTERAGGPRGLLDLRLDEPIATALARSTYRFRPEQSGSQHGAKANRKTTCGVSELFWRHRF